MSLLALAAQGLGGRRASVLQLRHMNRAGSRACVQFQLRALTLWRYSSP
eukprot:CAMPEP_0170275864 /NCGR_PEP_ID=MMETSP0116_2-20130129/37916_1 /TAXON_ID=400756 /ORGANISM="Durinskia baltica, Strain CSIRO CS-38" /LENGTH=48 /DNA_ID= /DNA_START= /DNA_END= /DNA_ORIENTATION=